MQHEFTSHLSERLSDEVRKLSGPIAWLNDSLCSMQFVKVDIQVEYYPYTKVRFEPRPQNTINSYARKTIREMKKSRTEQYSAIATALLREP